VEFRVLGPLEVSDKGESLALGGQKQRALLAILLLHANEVVSSDRLIDELWGETPPETAAKGLQVHVSQLRKLFEPARERGKSGQLLLTRSPGYLLKLDPDQLDVERFKRLADQGREALASGDPERAAAKLTEALSLWRGDPLADLTYASFAQSEISRLEEMRLAALEDRIEADLQRGRHASVIGDLERLISSEPLRERPRRQLMLALYRSDRQAEALEAYRESRATLVDELGIEPSRSLQDLHAAILAQDPSLDAAVRPSKGVLADVNAAVDAEGGGPAAAEIRVPHIPAEDFVGRKTELSEIDVALQRALRGQGGLLLIGGEPGIGKSRLADELSRRASALEAEVVRGRCWEAGGSPAYWPWVQALRGYVREVDPNSLGEQLGRHGGEVAHVLPELREILPNLSVLESPDSEGARFRVFDATTAFIKRAASERPLVIVLEDLHAADVPTLLLLQFMCTEIADARVLIVGTYRDIELSPGHPLSPALLELGRNRSTQTILLTGLGESEVARLIELTTDEPPSPGVSAAIRRGTGGNPLFVGELVRLLTAEGELHGAAEETELRLAIPEGIREVIARRLEQVSEHCGEVLGMAAVLGREFNVDSLAEVSERSPAEVLELLDEAAGKRVVAEVPGSARRFRFAHALIRDALYEDLGTGRRMELHRIAGEAIERLYRDPNPYLAELAYHFFEAGPSGNSRKVFDYSRRAGDRAAALLAYEEGVRLYQLAMRVLDAADWSGDSERRDTLLALGNSQAGAGDEEAAMESFLAAAHIARRQSSPESLAQAALGYGGRWVWISGAARGDAHLIPLLEEALDFLDTRDGSLRARLLARLACAVRDQPFRERRLGLSQEAVEIGRRLGDDATLAYALGARCIVIIGADTRREFAETALEVIRIGEATEDARRALTGWIYRHVAELQSGDMEAASRPLEIAARIAEEAREPALRSYITGVRAALALFRGEFDSAPALIDEAYALGRDAATFNALSSYLVQRFVLYRERGEPPYDEDALRRWDAESVTYTILRCARASLLLEQGRRSEAGKLFESLAQDEFGRIYVDEEFLASMTLLADVCRSLGDTERAGTIHAKLEPYSELNAIGYPELVLGSVQRPLAVLAAMMGHSDEAGDRFERAREMNESMGSRPWTAHTLHDHARMLAARGADDDRGAARERLHAALDIYRELDMKPWCARAEAELEALTPAA
jgi:DNA-binding SARP family transcriptional activator